MEKPRWRRLPRPSSSNLKQIFKSVCKNEDKTSTPRFKEISRSPNITYRRKKRIKHYDVTETSVNHYDVIDTKSVMQNSTQVTCVKPINQKSPKPRLPPCGSPASVITTDSGRISLERSPEVTCQSQQSALSTYYDVIDRKQTTERARRVLLKETTNSKIPKSSCTYDVTDTRFKNPDKLSSVTSHTETIEGCDNGTEDHYDEQCDMDSSVCSLVSLVSESTSEHRNNIKPDVRRRSPGWTRNRSFFLRMTENRRKQHKRAWESTKSLTNERFPVISKNEQLANEMEELRHIIEMQESEIELLQAEVKTRHNNDDCSNNEVTMTQLPRDQSNQSTTSNIETGSTTESARWSNRATASTQTEQTSLLRHNNFRYYMKRSIVYVIPTFLLYQTIINNDVINLVNNHRLFFNNE
ncbi:uncharacterized protein LOC100177054 [Ciona intestinalis]